MIKTFLSRLRFLPLSLALIGAAAHAQEEEAGEEAAVVWSHPRCEYILIKKADGHGIITQFSAERLKENDVITSDFSQSVNTQKKFVNKASGETGMLRGAAFELTRAQALKKIQGICKKHAPKE